MTPAEIVSLVGSLIALISAAGVMYKSIRTAPKEIKLAEKSVDKSDAELSGMYNALAKDAFLEAEKARKGREDIERRVDELERSNAALAAKVELYERNAARLTTLERTNAQQETKIVELGCKLDAALLGIELLIIQLTDQGMTPVWTPKELQ